ncbi:MAG: AzlC family ABC transporter permease [Eubacteriales bacterium]|nr:AzlC family ABC transporter permease [Eubacteriales bacterium]
MKQSYFKKGIKDGIPIGLGYFAVSFAFGIQAVKGGLTPFQAFLISLTNLTSAGQFAGVGVIFAAGTYWEMVLTQLIINARYCLMSFSISQKIMRDIPYAHRFGVAFGITDEIFGVSIAQEGKLSPYYSYGVMSMAIPGWSLGTLLGAVCGGIMPAMFVSALSVALYGMFLAVVIPPSKKNKAIRAVVLASMAMASLFKIIPVLDKNVSSGFMIIIVTIVVSVIAAIVCPVEEEENHES